MAVESVMTHAQDDEISLLDLVLVLAKHKKKIVVLPILAGVFAAIVAYSLPNQYTATLKIAPSKNAATYNWVLTNEQVLEQVAKDLKLADHYQTKTKKSTRKELNDALKVTLNAKDGFLDVNATDESPEFAAKLANRMGTALQQNIYGLRLLDVSKQRFELETRRKLAQSNKQKFDQITKQQEIAETIKQLTPADFYGITSLAAIQAESTLQGGVSDLMQNELVRMHDQLASLQRLVVDGMKKQSASANPGIWITAVDALQQQAYWDALIERLDRRIELLKKQEFDELKMTVAEVPDEKSGPKRALIVLVSVFAALFATVLWAFISEALRKSRQDVRSAGTLQQIANAWRSK
ncbi:Wzz/FepE/Etk N-terminal domain-containing protein [Chitinibacter tainanensis]|uniref:Wzz/FepE/Etk N-terminal domain-containing protein n=1 Tax=Chitinibacter tainanensis TaxID=230667 RepID=UPI0023524646|nr:Wzz/FepE/Etk N-terminal domain-containing protein [Chitinibacter tainanensis]